MMAYLKNPTRRVQVGGKVLFFRLQTFYLITVFFMKPFLLKLPKIILFWRSEFRERGKFAIWVNPRERSILEMSPTRRLQRPRLLNHFILVRTLSLSLSTSSFKSAIVWKYILQSNLLLFPTFKLASVQCDQIWWNFNLTIWSHCFGGQIL